MPNSNILLTAQALLCSVITEIFATGVPGAFDAAKLKVADDLHVCRTGRRQHTIPVDTFGPLLRNSGTVHLHKSRYLYHSLL